MSETTDPLAELRALVQPIVALIERALDPYFPPDERAAVERAAMLVVAEARVDACKQARIATGLASGSAQLQLAVLDDARAAAEAQLALLGEAEEVGEEQERKRARGCGCPKGWPRRDVLSIPGPGVRHHEQCAISKLLRQAEEVRERVSLSDDLAAAEQQARDAVRKDASGYLYECDGLTDYDLEAALDRLMAVCMLAGRWELVREFGEDNPKIAAELVALTGEMEP